MGKNVDPTMAQVTQLPVRTTLEEVADGLYVADGDPARLLQSGDYLTWEDFVAADEGLGIPKGNGKRTFNFLALGLAGEEDYEAEPLELRDDDLPATPTYWRIYYMLHSPDLIKSGSRDRVLLATQAAHSILEELRKDPTSWALGRRGKQVLQYVVHDVDLSMDEI